MEEWVVKALTSEQPEKTAFSVVGESLFVMWGKGGGEKIAQEMLMICKCSPDIMPPDSWGQQKMLLEINKLGRLLSGGGVPLEPLQLFLCKAGLSKIKAQFLSRQKCLEVAVLATRIELV